MTPTPDAPWIAWLPVALQVALMIHAFRFVRRLSAGSAEPPPSEPRRSYLLCCAEVAIILDLVLLALVGGPRVAPLVVALLVPLVVLAQLAGHLTFLRHVRGRWSAWHDHDESVGAGGTAPPARHPGHVPLDELISMGPAAALLFVRDRPLEALAWGVLLVVPFVGAGIAFGMGDARWGGALLVGAAVAAVGGTWTAWRRVRHAEGARGTDEA